MMGGKNGKQNSPDKSKKQKVVLPVWRSISTESDVDCKSEPKPVEGYMITPIAVKTELVSEMSNEDSRIANDANDAGKLSISIQVDVPLIRFIKGKGGLTQRQIEEEMGVKIIFPSGKNDTSIVIEGTSNENVTKASEKVRNILEQATKSPNLDYSHFVSFPLAIHPELLEKLQKFQNSVLGEVDNVSDTDQDCETSDRDNDTKQIEGSHTADNIEARNSNEHARVCIDATGLGIDKSIFIKPGTFHLTVLMLKLWNKDRVAKATEVLKGISSQLMDALDNRPIFIRLTGLACMRGSPAKAQVLYAPVEEVGGEGRMLRACQVIIDAFVEAGLVLQRDACQSLKLHATLMNVRHRKRNKRNRRHDSFDARNIFETYGSEDWGSYLIKELHLSQRFLFDESGYYHCCASIPFPESMDVA